MPTSTKHLPDIFDRAKKVMPGGNTRSTVFVPPRPPYAVEGSGAFVTDETGRSVIDCNNNYTSLIHGHAHESVLDVALDAAKKGTAFGLPTRYEVDMAECLAERTGIQQWRFCNSGTEAVLMMLRAARAHTGRDIIIRFEGSYHGTGDEVVDQESLGVPASTRQSVLVLPQNDLQALSDVLQNHSHRTAAVLIDLMPNRAGLQPATHEFVQALRALTRHYDVLLAVDEVISLRLSWGGFHKHYGVEPDLISVGKIIGGGFPAGAIGGSPGILKTFSPTTSGNVMWGGTFTANPVTMAAGLTALRLYDEKAVLDLNIRGDHLRRQLKSAGIPVNGFGSLMRIVTPNIESLWWNLYDKGVLAGSNGLLALSTAMTDDHIQQVAEAVIGSTTDLSVK
ncbi:aminotransferase class III-fold pyridoxal phosphate-dependent enzyme [Pseudarthrobacter sp. CC4]|uniref:aspartate aminotransferase family protein n=1 Tax=Pseudarthrobacter sp. CC4 TaxID=3029190 RepID=UPI003B8C066C